MLLIIYFIVAAKPIELFSLPLSGILLDVHLDFTIEFSWIQTWIIRMLICGQNHQTSLTPNI